MEQCILELPYPPSVNAIYRHAVRGKHSVMFMTDKGKQYQTYVRLKTIEQGQPRFHDARLAVFVEVFPPDDRKRDLGNLDKILMDSLEKAGVFLDDSQIDDSRYIRRDVVKEGKLIVHIQAISSYQPNLL